MMNKYCVYAHINKINNKAYIGITNRPLNIRQGCEGRGYKNQPKFYNAIQKYGWDNFTHIVLKYDLTETEALAAETEYIIHYNSIDCGYNVLLNGIKSYPRNKKVFCLTTGILYNSIKEAASQNNTTATRIIENCKGKNTGTKNLQWCYWDDQLNQPQEKEIFIPKIPSNAVAIYCIELERTFPTMATACRELDLDKSGLQKALNGKRNGIKGYHFVRVSEKDRIPDILKKRTGKKQKVYCLENNKVFESIQEAAMFCNRTPQSVMKNCQGKNKTCAGYHFSYYNGDNNV